MLGRIGLALAGVGLVLVVAECVARIIIARRPPTRPPPLATELRKLPQIESWKLAAATPNLRGLHAGVLFETNSAGFRGPERSPEKPPGVFRIVVIGDSVAMGWGVAYEDTYSARVEAALGSTHDHRSVEVLDLGVADSNAGRAVSHLEDLGMSFDPDMVVYGLTLNDIESDHYRRSFRLARTLPLSLWTSPSYLWRLLGRRWMSLQTALLVPRGSYLYELDDNYFHNPAAWELMLDELDELAGISREHDMCTVVLVHTHMSTLNFLHPYRRHYQAVGDATTARGFFVAQSLPSFLGESEGELWVSPIDPHPSAEGHRILADVLLRRLQTLPASCWN